MTGKTKKTAITASAGATNHHPAVVRFMADDVMVMKDGRIVEHRRTETLLAHPQEEYTRRLIGAVAQAPAGALRRDPATAPRP